MESPLYRSILALISIIFLICAIVLSYSLIKNKGNQTTYQNISNTKVSYDVSKIPNTTTQNYVKNTKNISIILSEYIQEPAKFPISFVSQHGNYEYNVTFNNEQISILFAPDLQLFSNKNIINKILTRLILSSSMQNLDKKPEGSLFDIEIR